MRASLFHTYPRRFDLVLLLIFNLALLSASYNLPFMKSHKLFFFHEEYTLLKSIAKMVDAGYYTLAGIVFLFSVIFPILKLFLLLTVWFIPFHSEQRNRLMLWISTLGKWSMLDVFIVAMLVILVSARAGAKVEPLSGLYIFMFAILLSMMLTQWIQRLARVRSFVVESDQSV